MRNLFSALLPAALALSSSLAAQPARPLDTAEVRRWTEDLDFLAREMPARHANLFHSMRREQFDSALANIRTRLPSFARHQIIVELQRLAALINDGHSRVAPWQDTIIAFHTLPIAIYKFGDGYHVRAAATPHANLLGARVTKIGSVSIDSAEALVSSLVSRDNAMGIMLRAPMFLTMPEVLHAVGLSKDERSANFTFEIDGRSHSVTLGSAGLFPNLSGEIDKFWNARSGWSDLRDRSPAPRWLSRTLEAYWFTYVPEGKLLYCQINEIQQHGETFTQFMTRALATADSVGAERFVLDLRLNGGGNGDYNRHIIRALVRSRFDEKGRLFVVTSRRTFSAAQMLISDLEKWTSPIFVGEPSSSRGNHYGDSRRLVMPNSKVTMRVSTLWWQYWDPRDKRPWIEVHIAAPLTVDAYRNGRDPALEAIARWR